MSRLRRRPSSSSLRASTFRSVSRRAWARTAAALADEIDEVRQAPLLGLKSVCVEVAGVECEHRTLTDYARGATPPNNLGFENAPFRAVAEAADKVKLLGLLGTPSPAATLHYTDFTPKVDWTGVSRPTP